MYNESLYLFVTHPCRLDNRYNSLTQAFLKFPEWKKFPFANYNKVRNDVMFSTPTIPE